MHLEDLEIIDSSKTVQKDTKEEKKWYVYMHTNKINQKRYIGITCQDPKRRWSNGNGYKRQPYFWRAIQKYGWDNFDHEILFENVTFDKACQLEQSLIKEYKANNSLYGYNVTDGGAGAQGYALSDEQKQLISEKAKERYKNPENHPMHGKHVSDETKEKISNALTGKYTKDTNPNTGRKHTEEEKIKMSQNRKGKNCGEDNYLFGKHLTDETKNKLSIKAKERYMDPKNHPMYGKSPSNETRQKISSQNKITWIDKAITIYSIELNKIFQGATDASRKIGLDPSGITKCCKGKNKSCGRHPETGEKLHWLYAEDAIEQGYITQQDIDDYLNSLKVKGD